MDKRSAAAILKNAQPLLAARGIAHAALFGSVARNEAKDASDIDILLTPAPGAVLSLFDLGALQSILEEAFAGLRVDIVLAPVRKPALRQSIERDAAHVF